MARPKKRTDIVIFDYFSSRAGVTNFSAKGLIINILGYAGHMVSLATTKLCHCSRKPARNNMQMKGHGCIPIKLYLLKQADLTRDHNLLTPVQHYEFSIRVLYMSCLRLLHDETAASWLVKLYKSAIRHKESFHMSSSFQVIWCSIAEFLGIEGLPFKQQLWGLGTEMGGVPKCGNSFSLLTQLMLSKCYCIRLLGLP